ncbi:MAG: hypothetical protein H0X04_04010 [Chthoniobacterales bacterium]|nr:hypothetical protein [Chthoniobacterales bacterium]
MRAQDDGAFRLNVLNPGGRDPEQHFGRTSGENGAHAPVNFHAYAACTGGSFLRHTTRALSSKMPALVLLRGGFRDSEEAVNVLKDAGIPVAVSLKETGLHQIADQLRDRAKLQRFLRIVARADGCLAPTPEAADIYRALRRDDESVAYLPTPYPLHDEHWDWSRPIEERRGILIGTREWNVPSRNHLAALLAARQVSETTGQTVTAYDFAGRSGARLLSELGFRPGSLTVLTKRTAYADHLRVVAQHRLVFQLDSSFVPGQVAGDALLCRVPCVGGNGALEREGFPQLCGVSRSIAEVTGIAERLLRDEALYRQAVSDSQERAGERLSFSNVAAHLQIFFQRLAARASK